MTYIGHHDSKKVEVQEVSYGTHTLPREFWTSNKPSLLKDPDYRARRAAKSIRTAKNKVARGDGIGNKHR